MKVKELTVKLPPLKPRDPNHLTLAAKKNAGGPMKDKKVAMKRGDFKHKGRAYEDMDLVEARVSKQEITPENVLAAMPGNWTDILLAMGWSLKDLERVRRGGPEDKKIQPILDKLVKDGKASTRSYPAEDTVYHAKKTVKEGVSLGSRVEYEDYDEWKQDLPPKATCKNSNGKERAQAVGKDFEGVAGTWDHETDSGWIYEYYLKKSNLTEAHLDEKKPAGAPDFHHSDAPDANGKFKELGVNDLADWLIKTRGGNLQKISGSLTQQIVFNRKKNPSYAKKMESVRNAVKRKLDKKKD